MEKMGKKHKTLQDTSENMWKIPQTPHCEFTFCRASTHHFTFWHREMTSLRRLPHRLLIIPAFHPSALREQTACFLGVFCLLHAWLIFSPNMTIQLCKCNFAHCFAFREDVATGEVWFGADALAKGLVDELQTSSEYIMQQIRNGHEVLEVTYKKSAGGGLAGAFGAALEGQQLQRLEALTALKSLLLGFNGFNGNVSNVSVTDLVKATGLASAAMESESWPKGLAQPRVEARWNEPQARLTRDLPEVWLAVPSQDLRDYLDEYKQIWDLVWPSDIMQWHQSTRCGCHQSSSLIRWFNDTINFPS